MHRREWLRLFGGGLIAAATLPLVGCSSALPAEAIAAWQQPAASLDLRHWILSHALLAPHSHNLQSWLVNLEIPDTILLRMDQHRLLPETDPFGRQMVMSQGTFIEILAIAAQQRGYRAEVTPFPEGEFAANQVDERPTASIRLIADASLRPDPLFAQIFQRRTNRSLYEARDPDAKALLAIAASTAAYPVRCGFILSTEVNMARHRQIANEAWRVELSTPRTLLESYKVLRVGPAEIAKHRDGLSLNDPFVRVLTATGLFDRSKASAPDSSEISGQIEKFQAKIAATPAFFWLVSERNDRHTQLQAGRAYVRAQLAATAFGLSMHPLQQALQEYPEQRDNYTAIHRLLDASQPGQTVQMWARLGYAPAVEPAPRRGLAAHLSQA
ncbi:twin-arginine translocation pathway signal protein [Chitinibacter sp. GC72]|uniref:Acg family FMN-binding oxidoreductase n=1 Tax=Chitinibacter sp. GC72 TaxID=1526917 RepID=UPI0012F75E65|nr:twin-arginine translocation pathway signal protein [Chitinibacter sp. GC72]